MKIIKSNETEYDDLKEIENKMKSEYYKTKKIICKEMKDFFLYVGFKMCSYVYAINYIW